MADDCYIGNGVKPNPLAGDPVHLAFSSTAGGSGAQPLVILDANMVPRTLKTYERLIVNSLAGDVSAGHVEVTAGSTLASSTLIGSFGQNGNQISGTGEGISLPVGVIPYVIPNSSSSTAAINLSGIGHIVEGTTQGVRPSWREATVRGD